MREVILTVNRKWFDQEMTGYWADLKMTREEVFEQYAKEWLVKRFGDDCVHARADLDESVYHIHAVILPRAVTKDGRRMLQPSIHPMIRNYEKAQDSVGEWFMSAGIGLKRGERRKQAFRDAIEHNKKVQAAIDAGATAPGEFVDLPEFRDHVTPRKGREAQEIELARREKALTEREAALAKRETAVEARRTKADAVMSVAKDVAEGRIDHLLLEKDDGGPDAKPDEANAPNMAHRIFGAALKVLRTKARKGAHAELAGAFKEIKAADDAIVHIARMLEPGPRRMVAEARKALSKVIVGLSRGKLDPGPHHKPTNQDR